MSELKERREKGEEKEKGGGEEKTEEKALRGHGCLRGEIKLVSFTSHFCPLPLNRVKGPLKSEELGLSSKNP